MNTFKTVILLTAITLLLILMGNMIAGSQGMLFAFMFAAVMNFVSYWYSDKIVLSMYNAKEIKPETEPKLYSMVSELALAANLPVPKIYYIKSSMPNAFATGRNPEHAVVALTEGLVTLLNEKEIRGVIAHELSHIKNRDILIGSVVATVAGAILMISRFAFFLGGTRGGNNNNSNPLAVILLVIIAPISAMLIQMAISRSREYLADESGASISRDPLALANALRKLSGENAKLKNEHVKPNTAHMFIVNPFSGKDLKNLFSTHPATAERIKKLEQMAGKIEEKKYSAPKVIY